MKLMCSIVARVQGTAVGSCPMWPAPSRKVTPFINSDLLMIDAEMSSHGFACTKSPSRTGLCKFNFHAGLK